MIRIEKYVPREKGALKGYLSISVDEWQGFKISDMAYFEQNDRRWINFPSREYTDKEGAKKYAAYNGFVSTEEKYAFQAKVIAALDKYLAETTPGQAQIVYQKSPQNTTFGEKGSGPAVAEYVDSELPF